VEQIEGFPKAVQAAIRKRGNPRLILGGRANGLRFTYIPGNGPLQRAELLLFSVDHQGRAALLEDWWVVDTATTIGQLKDIARQGGLAPVDHEAH
jgi:hypothetical protein